MTDDRWFLENPSRTAYARYAITFIKYICHPSSVIKDIVWMVWSLFVAMILMI